jgi:hypothetical protein
MFLTFIVKGVILTDGSYRRRLLVSLKTISILHSEVPNPYCTVSRTVREVACTRRRLPDYGAKLGFTHVGKAASRAT